MLTRLCVNQVMLTREVGHFTLHELHTAQKTKSDVIRIEGVFLVRKVVLDR